MGRDRRLQWHAEHSGSMSLDLLKSQRSHTSQLHAAKSDSVGLF